MGSMFGGGSAPQAPQAGGGGMAGMLQKLLSGAGQKGKEMFGTTSQGGMRMPGMFGDIQDAIVSGQDGGTQRAMIERQAQDPSTGSQMARDSYKPTQMTNEQVEGPGMLQRIAGQVFGNTDMMSADQKASYLANQEKNKLTPEQQEAADARMQNISDAQANYKAMMEAEQQKQAQSMQQLQQFMAQGANRGGAQQPVQSANLADVARSRLQNLRGKF